MPVERPYGSWKSPLTADLVAAESSRPGTLALEGEVVYWSESTPLEAGRYTIMRTSPGSEPSEILPPPWNARTRVHEYGGASFLPVDGALYFTNFADQQVYRISEGSEPQAVTRSEGSRFADFGLDRSRRRVVAVEEHHAHNGDEPVNRLVAIPLDGIAETHCDVLVSGHDFYACPRVSPDGTRLAWISWSHPNMPWDGAELWVGELDAAGAIQDVHRVAGGKEVSIFQPEWSPDGTLHFVSDQTGWWNLYRLEHGEAVNLCAVEEEFGLPLWTLGLTTYAFAGPEMIVAASCRGGRWSLQTIDTASAQRAHIPLPSTVISAVAAMPGAAVVIAASPVEATAVAKIDLKSGSVQVLHHFSAIHTDRGCLSVPGAMTFATSGGATAYGFFYPPQNYDFVAPAGELPPLIVQSHGGPTGATNTGLSLPIQFWTSRGFAVLDVDYRGSTGYGRAYRNLIDGQWGIADVDDCVYGALHLAAERLVDPNRLAIHGRSASGFTTLAALTFRDVFKAGVSSYGICDLEAIVLDTHKFESRYTDRLIGPWPEDREIYVERSPIHAVERLHCPLCLFHGIEDRVVPINQARMMYEAALSRGLPVALVEFDGEQHGFRKAESIRRTMEGELYFYGRVFGFVPDDPIEPLPIANLDRLGSPD